ncbi:MAG TPA: DUF2254 domain-containing protein [Candidatus Eremiobacteraeota bacterium]|nr:DUF2254 domain-containing protein [Candidatus Eremiobacteraeota bacterium]
MFQRLKFISTQIIYDLRTGLLFRPTIIAVSLAIFAIVLTHMEERGDLYLSLTNWMPWAFKGETASAQIVIGTIAGSIMTITTIIYSIMIMALTMASMQFSPRILNSFMRDPVNQIILGIFTGTFIYCLLVLRTIRGEPSPFVPDTSISIGILLALFCLGSLIYFIHYISLFIQLNHIVNHIAGDTEHVIKNVFPEKATQQIKFYTEHLIPVSESEPVFSKYTGYIQLIDDKSLGKLAKRYAVKLFVKYPVGGFVIAGNPIVFVAPAGKTDKKFCQVCLEAFDIGPVRTMQQDVGFGIRQIVDIALKAISPAVNDPTTATTCIDHLGRLLILLAKRHISPWEIKDPFSGDVIVSLRKINFHDALELAFTQIRQYGKSDMAVTLAMLRVIKEIASSTGNTKYHEYLWHHVELIEEVTKNYFSSKEVKDFIRLKEDIEKIMALKLP